MQTDKICLITFLILDPHLTNRLLLRVISSLILGSTLDRQTDKLRFISSSNWNIHITDRRTNFVSFHPSYWTRSKIDGQTTVYFTSYWNIHKTNRRIIRFSSLLILSFRQTDRQTRFYFTLNIGIFATQTDKLRYISSLILEAKEKYRSRDVRNSKVRRQDKPRRDRSRH